MPKKKKIEEDTLDVEVPEVQEFSAFSEETFEGFEDTGTDATFTAMSAAPALSGFDAVVGRPYTGPHGSWQEHVRKFNQGMI